MTENDCFILLKEISYVDKNTVKTYDFKTEFPAAITPKSSVSHDPSKVIKKHFIINNFETVCAAKYYCENSDAFF